jgi:SMC interacting uncharacterized protein involved in chromosome segregation
VLGFDDVTVTACEAKGSWRVPVCIASAVGIFIHTEAERLEQRQRDSMATIASQQQMLNESEILKDRYAQVQIELANMQHDKAKLERDMQSRQGNAKDMEVRLDSAAAESAAMLRRCEELRLAYENATAGKRELEQEVKELEQVELELEQVELELEVIRRED